jgi:hemoglobin
MAHGGASWRTRRFRVVAVILAVLAHGGGGGASAAEPKQKPEARAGDAKRSLYERLGGLKAITAVVDDFTARVGKDGRISAKFAKSDPNRLRVLLIEQICEATGGPCRYTGRSMMESHAGMEVTAGEFDALVEDLVASLERFKVGKAEQDELLAALAPMKKEIVEVESAETGTPLPADFKPAPPIERKTPARAAQGAQKRKKT